MRNFIFEFIEYKDIVFYHKGSNNSNGLCLMYYIIDEIPRSILAKYGCMILYEVSMLLKTSPDRWLIKYV